MHKCQIHALRDGQCRHATRHQSHPRLDDCPVPEPGNILNPYITDGLDVSGLPANEAARLIRETDRRGVCYACRNGRVILNPKA